MSAAPRMHTLDAMRGVAAIAVVLFHFMTMTARPVLHGYLAVDFFFALSGLVIGRTYGDRLASGRLSIGRFAALRVVRLYPLYALGTLAGIAKAVLSPFVGTDRNASIHAPVIAAVCATLMLPSPGDPDFLFPYNFPAWSLFLELLVNLLFAIVLARVSTRMLSLVIAAGIAGLVAIGLQHGTVDLGSRWNTLDGGAVRTLLGFAIGMMIGRVWHPVPVRSSARALLPPLLLAALLLAPVPSTATLWVDFVCIVGVVPLLVLLGMSAEPPPGGVRVAAWFGDISYPLYAVHAPFVQAAGRVVVLAGLPLAPTIGATLIALLVVATLLARWYDGQVRAWLSARLGLRPTAPLQAL